MIPAVRPKIEQNTAMRPSTFGLRTLLLAIAGVALVCGGGQFAGVKGMFGALSVVCLFVGIVAIRRGSSTVPSFAMPGALASFMLALLVGAVDNAREAANNCVCQGRMYQLGHAIQIYVDLNSTLPPVYTTDSNGKPLHSWRTLLLPIVEEQLLFAQTKLDEPWNSPANHSVVNTPLAQFVCDGLRRQPHSLETTYVAVVGHDTVWQPGRGVRIDEITDGPENTIMLIEMKNSGIQWAEPRDLDWNNPPPTVDKNRLVESLSNHPQGLNVIFADWHRETLPSTIPIEQFEALLTKSGG